MHVCDEQCRRRPGLVDAHERTRQRMRAKRLAKLHGKRPRLRRTTHEVSIDRVSMAPEAYRNPQD